MDFCASVMCLDLLRLGAQIRELEDLGVDRLHVDLIDGHYAANLGLPFDLLSLLRRHSCLPIDVHLLVSDPGRFLDRLALDDVASILVHWDAVRPREAELRRLEKRAPRIGLVFNSGALVEPEVIAELDPAVVMVMTCRPGFMGQGFLDTSLATLASLDQLRRERGLRFSLAADGAVGPATIERLVRARCDEAVIGSTLFPGRQVVAATFEELRQRMKEAEGGSAVSGGLLPPGAPTSAGAAPSRSLP